MGQFKKHMVSTIYIYICYTEVHRKRSTFVNWRPNNFNTHLPICLRFQDPRNAAVANKAPGIITLDLRVVVRT